MAQRQGAEFWRKHLETWGRSELTQVGYCAAHGLSIKSFRRWRRRQKEGTARANTSLTLVPVKLGSAAAPGVVRVRSPGGWQIELPGSASASWWVQILRQLP